MGIVCLQARDGSPFVDVACGWAHSVALSRSGAVFAWGLNCKGQLGVGDTKARAYPTQIVARGSTLDHKAEESAGEGGSVGGDFEGSDPASVVHDNESKLEMALEESLTLSPSVASLPKVRAAALVPGLPWPLCEPRLRHPSMPMCCVH